MAGVLGRSSRGAFEVFEGWQTAALNALNNRGQALNNRESWSKLPRSLWRILGLATPLTTEGRPLTTERAVAGVLGRSSRGAFEVFEGWQTAALNALNNRGQALNNRESWSKLPRSLWRILGLATPLTTEGRPLTTERAVAGVLGRSSRRAFEGF